MCINVYPSCHVNKKHVLIINVFVHSFIISPSCFTQSPQEEFVVRACILCVCVLFS